MSNRIDYRHHGFERHEMRHVNYRDRRHDFRNQGIFNHRQPCTFGYGEQESSGPKTFFGKLFKNLGKASSIGLGVGSLAIYEARKNANIFGETTGPGEAGKGKGSSTGNVLGGAAQGAMSGASLGSIIPGLGTGFGALAGGLIGGIGKLFGNKKAAEKQNNPTGGAAATVAQAVTQGTEKTGILAGVGKVLGGIFGIS